MHSTDRILTTHAGSLPRPDDVVEMVRAQARGDRRDDAADAKRLRSAVAEVVRKQADIGLDIVDDGEFGKPSFVTYVRQRLGGLSEIGGERRNPWGGSRDALAFPDFYRKQGSSMGRQPLIGATAPITYIGGAALKTDLENLKAAMQGLDVAAVFVPSISPANIENWHENRYYGTAEEYLTAICDAMLRSAADGRWVEID